ncbi:ABC transporter permease [Lachnospiraceae bacterium 45-W7]
MAKKRIFLSLIRRKSNWCMCLLMAILATLIFTGALIWQASSQSIKELEKTYGSSFKLASYADRSNPDLWEYKVFDENYSATIYIGPRVSLEMLERISGEIDGIVNYEWENKEDLMNNHILLVQMGFQLVPGFSASTAKIEEENYKQWKKGAISDQDWQTYYERYYKDSKYDIYDTVAYGLNNSQYSTHFRNGTFRLVSGRHISPSDYHVAMVTPTFAKLNGLKIGDTIPLMVSPLNASTSFDSGVLGTVDAVIIGMFEPTYEQPVNEYTSERDILNNWILIDLKTCSEMEKISGWSGETSLATIYVDDPSMTGDIMEQVKRLDWLDKHYYGVEKDDSSYHEAAAPIRTLRLAMGAGIAILAASGAALMYLILKHSIGRRERETGILMALGITGKSIKRQLLTENLILGVIAFLFAVGIANAAAPMLGDSLLHTLSPKEEMREYTKEEIDAAIAREDYEAYTKMTSPQTKGIEAPDTLSVHTSPFSILVTGFGMAILICLCVNEAMEKTLRLEPSRILSMIA